MSRKSGHEKFGAWLKKEMNIVLLTNSGEKSLPEDEMVAMACAVRARVLVDLAREGPLPEHVVVARCHPPEIPNEGNGAAVHIFLKAIIKALDTETGEIERGPPGITLRITDEGRKNIEGTTRSGRTIFPPDNGRGR